MSQDTSRAALRLYWDHVRKYPKFIWGIGTLLPITLLIHQFLPQLVVAAMISKLSSGQYTPGDLWGSFGWQLLLYTVLRMSAATYLWRWIIIMLDHLEARVLKDIANKTFRHFLQQSQSFHADQFSGTLVSQTTKYMSGYVRLAESAVMQIAPLALAIFFAAVIMLPKAPYFVAILLFFCTIYMVIIAKVGRKVRTLSSQDAEAQSKQTGQLADIMSNILTVKSFAATDAEVRRFGKITQETQTKTLLHTDTHNRQQLFFSGLTSGITSLSIVVAIASVVMFDTDIAVTYLIIDYSTNIVAKLWSFSAILRDLNRGFGEAHDMVGQLATEPSVKDPEKPDASHIHKGEIHFDSISFKHADAGDALFKDFTLHITAGEKIGLVGKSGAGKTTITKLLMRFSDVTSGSITIDGQKIDAITQDALRKSIAYVPQEPLLFHRTIGENIGYGLPGASNAQIIAAAKKAHAHEFISKLPNTYDTLVGERGVKLSGGQRQRIAIARAILKKSPILVLDEATSALDSESEALIQDSLRELMKQRTAIVIAHRLSTVQKMDRILVLDDGKIIEDGSHTQLLRKKGTYASLWKHQSGGFLAES